MRRALGWMCWQIVMAWPSALPIAEGIVKRAALRAAVTPNAPHEGPGGFSPGPLDAVVGPQGD